MRLGSAALTSREGVRPKACLLSVGVPTLGYGHTQAAKLGQIITQARAGTFIAEDLAGCAPLLPSCTTVPVADVLALVTRRQARP
jgi:lysozyme